MMMSMMLLELMMMSMMLLELMMSMMMSMIAMRLPVVRAELMIGVQYC